MKRPIFSIVLLSGRDGVLSIGGTAAQAAEMVDKQTSEELDRAGAQEKIIAFTKENGKTLQSGFNSLDKSKLTGEKIILHKRETEAKDFKATLTNWAEGWTWVKVQGAEGWWQTLMQGVWVGGSRVLRNQAVVIDVRWLKESCQLLPSNSIADQHALYPCSASSSQNLLRISSRFPSSGSTIFELLCLSLYEPPLGRIRVQRHPVPCDARGQRPGVQLCNHSRR